MVDNVRRECIMSMYEIYPLSRKLVFDTFDKKKYDITRTQQIIMLSLCIEGTLTMSQLASKINTSNEQATRAVAQLVDKGFGMGPIHFVEVRNHHIEVKGKRHILFSDSVHQRFKVGSPGIGNRVNCLFSKPLSLYHIARKIAFFF